MPMPWTRSVAALPLAAAALTAVRAQEPRRLARVDSVPYELVSALLGGVDPQIMLGDAPPWALQHFYLPANGHILGSSYIGTGVTTVVILPLASDTQTTTQVRGELMRRGWTEPVRPTVGGGGFRPAAMAAPVGQTPTRFTLCNAEYVLSGDVRRHAGEALYLTYRLSGGGTSICHPPMPAFGQQTADRPSLPTLYEPAPAQDPRSMTACFPQNVGASSGTTGLMRTPMSADQLLEHFARQLADSGWTRIRDSATVARGAWTKPDSTGAPERLTLNITAPRGVTDPQCHQAELTVTRTRKL